MLKQRLHACDLRSGLELRRHEARILEHPVRNPDLLRHEAIVVELQRPARAGQVIEFACRDRRLDPLLDETIEELHQRCPRA